jgi:ABC-type lipoprotein export system ATPase subunit
MKITVPELSLVLLVGPSGCGKSTFAQQHFKPTEVLVKAITQGGNVDEAIKDFEKNAPTTERIEEYIEHPVTVASTEVEKLTVRLCRLITQNDAEQRKEILALAREVLAKLEPTTVHRVSGGKKKGPHTASRERVGGHGERDVSSAAADKWPGTENRMKSD